jgi:signal transduction histidine kinase
MVEALISLSWAIWPPARAIGAMAAPVRPFHVGVADDLQVALGGVDDPVVEDQDLVEVVRRVRRRLDDQRAVHALAHRLGDIDATRGRLLSDLSHELRTPVATLSAFVDGLDDASSPPVLPPTTPCGPSWAGCTG